MSEIFTIVCENIAVSAAQDILCAYAAATGKIECLGFEIAQNGQTTLGNIPLRLRVLPATVTAGSGGGTVTPRNVKPNGAVPTAFLTARRNDTTQASSGTPLDIVATQLNPINGNYWQPPNDAAAPMADLSGAIVLSLDAAPAGTINLSATMWLRAN